MNGLVPKSAVLAAGSPGASLAVPSVIAAAGDNARAPFPRIRRVDPQPEHAHGLPAACSFFA